MNKDNFSDHNFDRFDIDDVELPLSDDRFGALTESLISITRLALNNATELKNNPSRLHPASGSYADDRDVDVALYYALYDINSDLAIELLSSYRSINRVSSDITNAIEGPLDAIGLGANNPYPQPNVSSSSFTDTSSRRIIERHTDIDMIAGWIHFLLSLDALPYYILICSVFVLLSAISIARSRQS